VRRPRLRNRRRGDFRCVTLAVGDKVITIAGTGVTFAELRAALETFGSASPPTVAARARDRRRRSTRS
jgi:hypothetical protein